MKPALCALAAIALGTLCAGGSDGPRTSPGAGLPIAYELSKPGQVSLAVYDSNGRQVRTLLTGEKQEAGRQTVTWDGLDRYGKAQAPGRYEWRMLCTPGFKREFLVNVGTNVGWAPYDLWPGNHWGPTSLATDADGALYVAAISSEGPPCLTKLSMDGKKKFWDTGTWGLSDGTIDVAPLGDAVYLLDWDAQIRIRRADNGRLFYGDRLRAKFAEKRMPFADVLHAGDNRAQHGNRKNVSPMCMTAGPDFLVLTYRNYNEVRVLWPEGDRIVKTQTLRVPAPKGAAVAPDGRVYVVSGHEIVLVDWRTGGVKKVVTDPGQRYPTRLAYDPEFGDLLVVQNGPGANCVRRYAAENGNLIAVYGRPAGRTYGLFNPLDWDSISDIAADGKGGFVTVEDYPRRVATFRGREKHEVVNQWFGGMQWGPLAVIDPANPTIVYLWPDHKHCGRATIDYGRRTWKLTHLYDAPAGSSWNVGKKSHAGMLAPFGGGSFWQVRHVGADTFLVNCGGGSGGEGVSVVRIDEKENKIVPVARAGALHPTNARQSPPGWWLAAMQRAGFPLQSFYQHLFYTWSDFNRNGTIDPQEVAVSSQRRDYTGSHSCVDAHWNLYRVLRQPSFPHAPANRQSAWELAPNKGKDPALPMWNWDDGRPSRAFFPPRELRELGCEPDCIFRDSAGNVYETCNGQLGTDVPPTNWPNNAHSTSRLLKWNAAGTLEWSVGVHSDLKNHLPGVFSELRGVMGEARSCVVVVDACSPASVWTRDGLYAGSFLDGRVNDGLSDFVYQRIMGDDNHWGQVFETPEGDVVWGAIADQSTPYYRIHGWDGWQRQQGSIELQDPMPAPRFMGQGLKVEYYDNRRLAGKPVAKGWDDDIWFGPLWGDHRYLPARTSGPNRSRLDPDNCSTRWTGFIEGPLTEEFVFHVYTYGDKNIGSKVRLWVDGKLIIDDWDHIRPGKINGFRRTRACISPGIRLYAGQLVPIKLEYSGAGGKDAHLHLYWKSASFDLRHVPPKVLYPERPSER